MNSVKRVLVGVAFSFGIVACGPMQEEPLETELGTTEAAVCRTGTIKCVSLNLTWTYENGQCGGTYILRPDAVIECAEWPCPEACVDSGYTN